MTNDPIEWLIDDGAKPVFDFPDALMVTEIPSATLQNWNHRGLFKPALAGQGQGTRRKYSANDLVVLAMASKLIDLNVTAHTSLSLALDVWIEALKEAKRSRDPLSLGNTIAFVKTSRGGKLKTAIVSGSSSADFSQLMDGQPVIMFAAGVIIQKVAARAMDVSTIAERPAKYSRATVN